MAVTQSYVDYGAGSDATGDGTIGTPWKTLQWAFDHLVRNATDGNQVNLKAGTAHVNAAALDLATFIAASAMGSTKPLVVRGYTAAANDGGVGEIDCGGAAMWAATTYDYVMLADLEIHTFGDNNGIVLDASCTLYRCEIHKGASAPAGKYLLSLGDSATVGGCYLHDAGTAAARAISANNYAVIYGNYVLAGVEAGASSCLVTVGSSTIVGNIFVNGSTAGCGATVGAGAAVTGNVAYSTVASTASGFTANSNTARAFILNNIAVGWSGAGGEGINIAQNMPIAGYNAFWDNTTQYTTSDQIFINLTATDVTLAADPFTSAATGDFSLTTAAKAALRGVGWPAAYLGAHASTDGHVTIGAIQYGEAEAGGGAVRIVPIRGSIG